MKRNFVILLFLSLFLFITGCGSNKEEKKDGKIKLVFYYFSRTNIAINCFISKKYA